ncbi:MAG: HAD-IIA family hydrolase [Thermoleophilia bacterium]|nr:HAD-IIA family hydrolase [Thermoleophilia bacterium]
MASTSPLTERYAGLVLDLDGCLWVGDDVVPGAPAAVDAWRASERPLVFLTNDPRCAPEDLVQRLWSHGIRASVDEVITSGVVMQAYLADRFPGCDAVVVGSTAMVRHVRLAGLHVIAREDLVSRADVVVLAGHPDLTATELMWAVRAAHSGASVVATGRDGLVPTDHGVIPGTGAVVAYVEFASGAQAVAVGKPSATAWRTALDRLGVDGPVLAIGDRLDSDVAGACAAGLDAALVLTGVTDRDDLDAWDGPAPVAVGDDLAALLLG